VQVKVLARRREGDIYLRHIVLERCDNGRVVQFGIVRFDFRYVTDEVRDQILAEQTPLGRILINFNVLRHIDLGAIVRIWPGPRLQALFGCPAEPPLYGRLATIFCNQKPAVDLLEISAPVANAATA
jgi:chorismate-pyruvate lyase